MKKSLFTLAALLLALVMMSFYATEQAVKIKYPKKLAKGTEVPKGLKNMEKPRKKGTPPAKLMIPGDCTNLALEKEVTSSNEDPEEGDLEMITDDDADGNEFVQLKEGKQWIQIDLEESKTLYAAHLWHFHQKPRVYFDVIIQVSDDEDFIKGVKTVFNNDHDNSSGFGKGKNKNYVEEYYGKSIKFAKPVKGRYVRFYSNGNHVNKSNHYCEVHVYGK